MQGGSTYYLAYEAGGGLLFASSEIGTNSVTVTYQPIDLEPVLEGVKHRAGSGGQDTAHQLRRPDQQADDSGGRFPPLTKCLRRGSTRAS